MIIAGLLGIVLVVAATLLLAQRADHAHDISLRAKSGELASLEQAVGAALEKLRSETDALKAQLDSVKNSVTHITNRIGK